MIEIIGSKCETTLDSNAQAKLAQYALKLVKSSTEYRHFLTYMGVVQLKVFPIDELILTKAIINKYMGTTECHMYGINSISVADNYIGWLMSMAFPMIRIRSKEDEAILKALIYTDSNEYQSKEKFTIREKIKEMLVLKRDNFEKFMSQYKDAINMEEIQESRNWKLFEALFLN